nr:MAG TPA: hypothetical protein [Caudoviricetes sp.]
MAVVPIYSPPLIELIFISKQNYLARYYLILIKDLGSLTHIVITYF